MNKIILGLTLNYYYYHYSFFVIIEINPTQNKTHTHTHISFWLETFISQRKPAARLFRLELGCRPFRSPPPPCRLLRSPPPPCSPAGAARGKSTTQRSRRNMRRKSPSGSKSSRRTRLPSWVSGRSCASIFCSTIWLIRRRCITRRPPCGRITAKARWSMQLGSTSCYS